MAFKDFYAVRMDALDCGQVDGASPFSLNPFKPRVAIPLSVASPYYKDRDIWRHYPNLYDFRQAAIFLFISILGSNTPPPIFYPYNHPARQRHYIPEYLAVQDFRRKSPISKQPR